MSEYVKGVNFDGSYRVDFVLSSGLEVSIRVPLVVSDFLLDAIAGAHEYGPKVAPDRSWSWKETDPAAYQDPHKGLPAVQHGSVTLTGEDGVEEEISE